MHQSTSRRWGLSRSRYMQSGIEGRFSKELDLNKVKNIFINTVITIYKLLCTLIKMRYLIKHINLTNLDMQSSCHFLKHTLFQLKTTPQLHQNYCLANLFQSRHWNVWSLYRYLDPEKVIKTLKAVNVHCM